MGTSYGTVCKSCGNKEDYMLGVGFMSRPTFEYLKDSLESKVIKRHLHILEKQFMGKVIGVPSLEMFECPVCTTLHSKLQFSVDYANGKIFEPQYSCGICKSILVPFNISENYMGKDSEPKDYKCKKCGKATLERSWSITLWD